jgi:hypothetical protein
LGEQSSVTTTSLVENWRYPGARWWKFDFHTHTPASSDTPWHKLIGQPNALTAEQWLRRYMDAGIDCVAITDHNSGAWIDQLKSTYEGMELAGQPGFRELHMFPGVELSVSGGFHLLAVFDKEATTADIDSLLGAVEYDGTKGESDGVTRKSPIQVVEAVLAAGGLPIPAHADQAKGLLRLQDSQSTKAALDAQTIEQVLKCHGVLAMEVVSRNAAKPAVYAQRGLSWSEVLGSDCHSFHGQNVPGTSFTWIKMATPSLEGLRLALLDGEGFSVRRSDDTQPFDPFELPEHFIEAIGISEARYMGRGQPEKLAFSPWFNAVVGGRGTGKSTVVHFLRLGYRRETELMALDASHEARRTFESFSKVPRSKAEPGGMQEKTEILITLMRDGVRHRLRWRQDGAGALVEDEINGQWMPSASQIVTPERFPLRLFSQGQIGALAGENQEPLLAVIDEATDASPQKTALEESKRRFMALRAQGRELDGRLKGREQLRVQLDDVRRKLARFEEAHHAEVLKAFQICARQEREVARQLDAAGEVAARVLQVAEELAPDDVPEGLFDSQNPQDREALLVVERLAQAVRDVSKTLRESAIHLQKIAQQERTNLPDSGWYTAVANSKLKYTSLVDALKAQGVADPSEYGKLVQERQRLEGESARLDSLEKQRQQLSEQTQAQLQQVLSARRALSTQRQKFLHETLANNVYVRIELATYGSDPRAIERTLREALYVTDDRFDSDILLLDDDQPSGGAVADLLGASTGLAYQLGLSTPVAPLGVTEQRIEVIKRRIEKACLGQGDFGGHFNNFLTRAFEKSPEFLDHLLTWFPEDALRIEYSPKGDGQNFRPIGQASAGQRAAAMLAFLLAHGKEPIVLDQPEDDLDNHLIYDLVVRQIRANKLHRQIAVVTHNPNIVVNGDAEMLHALDFRAGQCRVVRAGSLQDLAMREEVCNVMEGGREAFESRYRRLGQEV